MDLIFEFSKENVDDYCCRYLNQKIRCDKNIGIGMRSSLENDVGGGERVPNTGIGILQMVPGYGFQSVGNYDII